MRAAYKTVDDKLDGLLGSYSNPACQRYDTARRKRIRGTFGEQFLGKTLEFHLNGQTWSTVEVSVHTLMPVNGLGAMPRILIQHLPDNVRPLILNSSFDLGIQSRYSRPRG